MLPNTWNALTVFSHIVVFFLAYIDPNGIAWYPSSWLPIPTGLSLLSSI
jgi:hypothetical protein